MTARGIPPTPYNSHSSGGGWGGNPLSGVRSSARSVGGGPLSSPRSGGGGGSGFPVQSQVRIPHPPVNRQTENITFPTLCVWAVTIYILFVTTKTRCRASQKYGIVSFLKLKSSNILTMVVFMKQTV